MFVPAAGGGTVSFTGIVSPLQPDDPRMAGADDRRVALVVATEDLPAARPSEGDDVTTDDDTTHRIIRADHDSASGLSTFLLTP